jgi:hypothetical protein
MTMQKLNELLEQATEISATHGSEWSSALSQDKYGNQAHEIICDSHGETVVSTGSNSNDASWLCDYLELCSPHNILAIAKEFSAMEKQRDALAAENVAMKRSLKVIASSEQLDGETVVCDFDSLVSVAAGAVKTPATDTHLNSVRESFLDEAIHALVASGAQSFGDCMVALNQLRAGEPS